MSARSQVHGGQSPSLTSNILQVKLRFPCLSPPLRGPGATLPGGPQPGLKGAAGPRWRLPNSEPLSGSAGRLGRACALVPRGLARWGAGVLRAAHAPRRGRGLRLQGVAGAQGSLSSAAAPGDPRGLASGELLLSCFLPFLLVGLCLCPLL